MALKGEGGRAGESERERVRVGQGLAVLLGRPCVSQPTAFLSPPPPPSSFLSFVLSSNSIFNEINN